MTGITADPHLGGWAPAWPCIDHEARLPKNQPVSENRAAKKTQPLCRSAEIVI